MTNPLTYQSLKCVLQYMEANKRIHIASRIPSIQKMEKMLPLHLDRLCLHESYITLNNISYQLKLIRVIDLGYSNHELGIINNMYTQATIIPHTDMIFEVDSKTMLIRRLPENLKFRVAMEKLRLYLLGQRYDVRVDQLDIYCKIARLPPWLLAVKFQFRELLISSDEIELFSSIVEDTNIPLKRLVVKWASSYDSLFHLPIVQSARILEIAFPYRDEEWLETLQKLPNREVVIDSCLLTQQEINVFVQSLVDTGRDIGTCYTFNEVNDKVPFVYEILKYHFEHVAKVNQKEKDGKPTTASTNSFYLSMIQNTELHIYMHNDGKKSQIKMEVVPMDTSRVQFPHYPPPPPILTLVFRRFAKVLFFTCFVHLTRLYLEYLRYM